MKNNLIYLVPASLKSNVSLEEALYRRHSTRTFGSQKIGLKEISQILWACYGKNAYGKKTVPSAGGRYPIDVYLIAGDIENLPVGLYQYDSEKHALITLHNIDIRNAIAEAAYQQMFISMAPAIIILIACFNRTTDSYGKRGERYVFIDTGHIGQNVSLQVETIGLATCMIGAFDDEKVSKLLSVKGDPVYIMPVGRSKT